MDKVLLGSGDILKTKRLILKRLCIDDTDLVFSLRSSAEVVRYTGIEQYASISDAINYIQRINDDIDDMNCLMWSISLLSSNEPIGTICFWNFSPDKKTAEIGYDLLPIYWGNGYIHEAIREALRFIFYIYGFETVFAEPRSENINSKRVLEKSGFRLIKEYIKGNKAENNRMCLYEIKKSNY